MGGGGILSVVSLFVELDREEITYMSVEIRLISLCVVNLGVPGVFGFLVVVALVTPSEAYLGVPNGSVFTTLFPN